MFSRRAALWSLISIRNIKLQTKSCKLNIHKKVVLPCTLGFSLFTWLGFEKQQTVEDELVDTIKHSVLFIKRSEYGKAEQLLHIALRQAQTIQHKHGITYIYDVMANLALEREQLDKAKELFVAVTQRIMADGATENDIRVIHLSAKLARISHLKKDYATAQLGYDWCLNKLSKIENNEESRKLLAMTEDWYGRLFLECNQNEQGLKMLVNSLDHMREVSDIEKDHIIVQLNDIGTVCDSLNRVDESINYFKEAIEIGKRLPDNEDLGAMYVNLGRVYLKKNLIDEARKSCGYGWRLGTDAKNEDIKREARQCINEINNFKSS